MLDESFVIGVFEVLLLIWLFIKIMWVRLHKQRLSGSFEFIDALNHSGLSELSETNTYHRTDFCQPGFVPITWVN